MEYHRTLTDLTAETLALFAPPPDLSLSEWADEFAYLSPESSAESGKWTSIEYQRGIMDAFTDASVERVTVMKSARVGYTKILNNVIAYHMTLDPCNMLVVQPTIEDAEGYSKDEIATMLRDTPCLETVVSDPKARDGSNTILKKSFAGGVLYLVGANSPRGFRRISARIVLFDEIDGYPASAGTEGDQIKLGVMRSQYFWNRKIGMGSTPTVKGESKIEREYESSDQRRYFVPCPHCGEFQILKWSNIQWPDGKPEAAYYGCELCGSVIEHKDKADMIAAGEWRATKPFNGHAGFHIWAGYSLSPNADWGKLAAEFLDCKRDTEALQTFINTVLGETWEEESEKLDWEIIQGRAEHYETPAAGAYIVTASADIQKDRIEVTSEGWAPGEENWLVEWVVLHGATDQADVWNQLAAYLNRTYQNDRGDLLPISAMTIDSGYNTDFVYSFVKKHQRRRVYATKGQAGAGLPIVSQATKKKTGRDPRKVRLFTIGVDSAKTVIYHRLQNPEPGPGFRHFPKGTEGEYFEGLVSEKIVTKHRRGFEYREWIKMRARNEPLDLAVGNLAALRILNPTWPTITGELDPPKPAKPTPRSESKFKRSTGGFNRR